MIGSEMYGAEKKRRTNNTLAPPSGNVWAKNSSQVRNLRSEKKNGCQGEQRTRLRRPRPSQRPGSTKVNVGSETVLSEKQRMPSTHSHRRPGQRIPDQFGNEVNVRSEIHPVDKPMTSGWTTALEKARQINKIQ